AELEDTTGVIATSVLTPDAGSISFLPVAADIQPSTKFITVDFTYTLPVVAFDKSNRIRFTAPNNTALTNSIWHPFIVRDSSIAYIYDINYLSGYDKSMSPARLSSLQGTDIPSDGVNVYSMPMGVEVL